MWNKLLSKAHIIHGDAISHNKTKLYRLWSSMKKRCYDVKNKDYNSYGGRGIKICDKWKENYLEFKNWALSSGYKNNLTIDRINNNGDYESSNCRWSTCATQSQNKRNNKLDWEKVRKIRGLKENNKISNVLLSKMFNVSQWVIWYVVNYKTWKENV